MFRVLTSAILIVGMLACPLVCRSGSCCGCTAVVLQECAADCGTCCDTDRKSQEFPSVPSNCDSQCLCKGALVSTYLPLPMVPTVEALDVAPVEQPGSAGHSMADPADDNRVKAIQHLCCLSVRLLV